MDFPYKEEKLKKNREIREKKKAARGVVPKGERPDKETFARTMEQFVRVHYQTDGEHKGNVIVKTKGVRRLQDGTTFTGKPVMTLVKFWQPDKLAAGVSGLNMAPHNGYYISANSFTRFQARKGQLFTLHNIVVDIDCHNWRTGADRRWMTAEELEHMMRGFVYSLEHDGYGIPVPNTVVYTGRGIQLWYALVPISAKCIKMYERSAKYIIEKLEQVILDNEVLLSIDRTASGSPAGMFRMPMTLNQSNGRYGKVDFIHDKPLDLAAFWEEAHGWEVPRFPRKKNDDPKMLADFRLSALTGFVRMRIHDGCTMEGVRDLTLFCLYNSMIGYYPDGTVMEKVMAVNSLFPVPLPAHEVETYLSTSRKRAKAGKAYAISNEYIIENLGILPEEQEQLGFFHKGTDKSQEQARAEARQIKEERDRQILELVKNGKNKKETADIVGCCASTVAAVLKKHGRKTREEKIRRRVCLSIIKGTPFKMIAKKTGRTLKNIRELARKLRNKVKATPEKKTTDTATDTAAASAYDEGSWQYLLDRYNDDAWARGEKKMLFFWHRGSSGGAANRNPKTV